MQTNRKYVKHLSTKCWKLHPFQLTVTFLKKKKKTVQCVLHAQIATHALHSKHQLACTHATNVSVSNCFYLWWSGVPCLAAYERTNGWGLIATDCACVAFPLVLMFHRATSSRAVDGGWYFALLHMLPFCTTVNVCLEKDYCVPHSQMLSAGTDVHSSSCCVSVLSLTCHQ